MSVKYLGVTLDSRLTWMEHVDVEVRKAQNLMWAFRRACGVTGPETHCSLLALRHYHQTIRYLCILGMVAWLPDGQCQEETRQGPKISLLRDNRSYAHYSHQCGGSTHLPPSTGVGGSERGEVSYASTLESAMFVLSTSQ